MSSPAPILEQIPEWQAGAPGWNAMTKKMLQRLNQMPEIVLDALATHLINGANFNADYNPTTKVFTFSASGGAGGSTDLEAVLDFLATNLQINGTTGTYDDPNNILNFVLAGTGYATVADEGTDLTARAKVNFIGRNVAASDNSGSTRTDVVVYDQPRVHSIGSSGASQALDVSASSGEIKLVTLTANCTFTFTGTVSGRAPQLEVVLTQDATGGRTVVWPTSVRWSGGTPSLSTAANAVDRFVFTTYDNGTTWYGDLIGKGYA